MQLPLGCSLTPKYAQTQLLILPSTCPSTWYRPYSEGHHHLPQKVNITNPCRFGSFSRNHSKQQVVLILPLPHPSNLSVPLFLHCLSSDTTTQSSSLQSCPPLIQSLHCNPRGLSKIETLLSSGETIHFLTLPVRAHGHLLS